MKHAGDAESIDCADGAKLSAAKPYAVLCLLPSERVSISNRAGRLIYCKEIVRLQLGNEYAKIFYGDGGLFANSLRSGGLPRTAKSSRTVLHTRSCSGSRV